MKDGTRSWVQLAEGDLAVAGLTLEEGFYSHCVFQCHEAIEKILKALWIEHTSQGVPPRIHDLPALAEQAGLELSQQQTESLGMLSEQYLPTRYGDVVAEYSREVAENYYRQTEELFSWLRTQLS